MVADILLAVRREQANRYLSNLSYYSDLRPTLATSIAEVSDVLATPEKHVDLLVLDNGLDGAFGAVADLRRKHPRLLIVLVDEEADFALPGQADEISIDPFTNDDLVARIDRLMSDRRLETLRADIMPPVREIVKKLRKAIGESGRQQAAVSACRDLGYDYVAFYRLESLDPLYLTLTAQDGVSLLQGDAPSSGGADDLVGWVAQTGQSRIAARGEEPTYALVRDGQFGAAGCAAVGITSRYGVIVACRVQPQSITHQDVAMLELVGAQLAAVLSKD